jgi:MFS family permease
MATSPAVATTSPPHQQRKAVFASWIGTTIELYDFQAYGLAASLILGPLFFPSSDPLVGTLLALATFAIGFVARPVGALVFGHFGDRMGRKTTLIVTLTMMGVATTAIGVLPTYAQIGTAAPVLLIVLRIVQGFSLGGEYSGAVLMTVEHTGEKQRGFFGSLVNTGTTAGLLLANLAFWPIFALPKDQLLGWGWRIPFLLSAVLVLVGFFVRRAVDETPEYVKVEQTHHVHKMPIVDVFRMSGLTVLLVAVAILTAGVTVTIISVFSLTYAQAVVHIQTSEMISVFLASSLVILIALPLFGWLGDRVGVRRVFLAGAASLVVLPFAWFALVNTGNWGLMFLGFVLIMVGYSANYAVVPAYFAQVFPAGVRFSGMAIGFTLGVIGGNAVAPLIAGALLRSYGSWIPIAIYMAAVALASLLAGVFLKLPSSNELERRADVLAAEKHLALK